MLTGGTYSDHWALKGWWSTVNHYLRCKRPSVNTVFDVPLVQWTHSAMSGRTDASVTDKYKLLLFTCDMTSVSFSNTRRTDTFKDWKCVNALKINCYECSNHIALHRSTVLVILVGATFNNNLSAQVLVRGRDCEDVCVFLYRWWFWMTHSAVLVG